MKNNGKQLSHFQAFQMSASLLLQPERFSSNGLCVSEVGCVASGQISPRKLEITVIEVF